MVVDQPDCYSVPCVVGPVNIDLSGYNTLYVPIYLLQLEQETIYLVRLLKRTSSVSYSDFFLVPSHTTQIKNSLCRLNGLLRNSLRFSQVRETRLRAAFCYTYICRAFVYASV